MMKKTMEIINMKNINRFLICIFLCMMAVSCSNLFSNDTDNGSANNTSTNESPETKKTYSFKGTLSISGAVPSSRSAIPYISGTEWNNYYWYIEATCDGNKKSINSKTNSNKFTTSTNPTHVEFIFENLDEGTWNFTAELKKLATPSSSPATTDLSIMKDTYPNAVIGGMTPIIAHTFLLKPSQTSNTGTGSIELPMTIDSSVKKITATSTTGWTSTTIAPTSTSVTLSLSNVPSNTYEVTLSFYNSTATNAILLYTTIHTINVFDNMTTNTWLSDGTALFNTTNTPVTFELTDTIIKQFAKTTLYVGVPSGLTGITASDNTGTGSPYAPLQSIAKAVQIIAASSNSTTDYRIFICGTITGTQKIESITTENAKSITIKGYSGNTTDILNGGTSGSVLFVDTTVPVTITNLKITGGKGTTTQISSSNSPLCGGGINIKRGTVTLSTNALITGNHAAYGGGVYVASEAKLFMSANSVVGNPITNSTTTASAENYTTYSNCANYATAFGGGIYVNGGELYLGYTNGTTPTLDETFTGGVIRNACIKTDNNSGVGGGIYCNGSIFKMSKGKVAYNYSELYGGGIKITGISSIFDFSGGSIEKNTTVYKGGGIHITETKVYMSGTALIGDSGTSMTQVSDFSNKAIGTGLSDDTVFGGGVWMDGSSSKLYLGYTPPTTEGGEAVIDNSFTGGICHNYSAISSGGIGQGSGLITINKGYISYNKCEKNGGGGSIDNLTMTGGNFISNTCGENGNGGAIYYSNGNLNLSGGTFTANTCGANGNGGAIFVNLILSHQSFNFSGSVSFPSGSAKNNDIYLKDPYLITLGTNISGGASITPEKWTRGNQIFAGGTNVTDQALSKFTLSDSDWSIEKYGSNSNTKGIINADIYVSASGNDSNTGATTSKAFKTIAAAAKACNSYKHEIKVSGALSSSQQIPDSTDVTASSITLSGMNNASITASSSSDAFTVAKAITLTITNITFTGATTTNKAGIYISNSSADVRLGSGVKVEGNYNGISNSGKLCLYGDAIVGKNVDGLPTAANDAGNSFYGIKNNSGQLWIGYTEPAADKADTSFSGGVKKNWDRGIYIGSGSVYISKGAISFNAGGGIDNQGTLTVSGGNINSNKAQWGGGIFNGGTLTISGNATINSNEATSSGGGIYHNSTGLLTISGGEISNNTGSGITVASSSNHYIVMNSGKICKNTGRGIFLNSKSTFVMSGSASIGDSANSSSGNTGGGIHTSGGNVYLGYTYNNGTISAISGSMTGGIFYNSAADGGGMYIASGSSVYLAAGTISGNSATSNGGAIYHVGAGLHIKGSASLPCTGAKQNDIFLAEESSALKQITVDGALDGSGVVATITPVNYESTTNVVKVSGSVTLAQAAPRFAVNPDGSTEYTINTTDGKLKKAALTVADITTAAQIYGPYEEEFQHSGRSMGPVNLSTLQGKLIFFRLANNGDCEDCYGVLSFQNLTTSSVGYSFKRFKDGTMDIDVTSGLIEFSDYTEFPDEDILIGLSASWDSVEVSCGDMANGDVYIGKDGSNFTFSAGMCGNSYDSGYDDWVGFYIDQ